VSAGVSVSATYPSIRDIHVSVRDRRAVAVELAQPGGQPLQLGTADTALRDPRITASERAAIRNVTRTTAYFRSRFGRSGVDEAGRGIRLILRDRSGREPYATRHTIVVGANPMRNLVPNTTGQVLPLDVAVHEYTHAIQWTKSQLGGVGWPLLSFDGGVAEGMADAVGMIATRDWSIGEQYLKPGGRYRSVRDAARPSSATTFQKYVTRYDAPKHSEAGSHRAGGVAARTFFEVQQLAGWHATERLAYAVTNDGPLWETYVDWPRLARGITAASERLWPAGSPERVAVATALTRTGLDQAAAPYEPFGPFADKLG